MIVTTDNLQYTENSIRTFTGKVFDLRILDPESICIEDIAHALSHTARFAGHLKVFYSVAQHSVLAAQGVSNNSRLAALLHDASEAYLGDMPSPFKKMMPEYKNIENRLMLVIARKFDFAFPLSPEVKEVDKLLLQQEWNSFVEPHYPWEIKAWTPEFAEFRFLETFYKIKSDPRWKSNSQPTP